MPPLGEVEDESERPNAECSDEQERFFQPDHHGTENRTEAQAALRSSKSATVRTVEQHGTQEEQERVMPEYIEHDGPPDMPNRVGD